MNPQCIQNRTQTPSETEKASTGKRLAVKPPAYAYTGKILTWITQPADYLRNTVDALQTIRVFGRSAHPARLRRSLEQET